MDLSQPAGENYANPKTCLFHVLFKAAALAFYILSALFFDSFVIIFVVTVILAALDFWVVKNISGRILVGLRWWNEINEQGESVWKFECLDQQSLARMNKKDSWLFWWTLYLSAVAWFVLGIFSVIRFEPDFLLIVGVCLCLNIANIVGFTKCRKVIQPPVRKQSSFIFPLFDIVMHWEQCCYRYVHHAYRCSFYLEECFVYLQMPRSRFKHLLPRLLPLGSHLQFSQHLAWYKFLEKKIVKHNNAGRQLNQSLSE